MRIFGLIFSIVLACVPNLTWARYPLREEHKPVSPQSVSLPDDLLAQLKRDLPGVRVISQKDYCTDYETLRLPYMQGNQGAWSYNALQGDFNGDYREDYALIVRQGGQYQIVAAVRDTTSSDVTYKIAKLGPPVIPVVGQPQSKILSGRICDGLFSIVETGELRYTVTAEEFAPIEAPGVVKRSLNLFPAIGMQGDVNGIYYYWKDGRWEHTGPETAVGSR